MMGDDKKFFIRWVQEYPGFAEALDREMNLLLESTKYVDAKAVIEKVKYRIRIEDRIRKLVHERLDCYIGEPNNEKNRQAIFEAVQSIALEFPNDIDLIEKVVMEEGKNGNNRKT